MLFHPIGTNVPKQLILFVADNAATALVHFKHGLKEPEKYADVQMVPVNLQDIERYLKAEHASHWKQVDAGEIQMSGGDPAPRDEISGSIVYGADF